MGIHGSSGVWCLLWCPDTSGLVVVVDSCHFREFEGHRCLDVFCPVFISLDVLRDSHTDWWCGVHAVIHGWCDVVVVRIPQM